MIDEYNTDVGYLYLQILKEEFKDHFRNVSRIMDCVGCDKCRLWGKVQVTGVASALKILFELDEKALEWVSYLPLFPSFLELPLTWVVNMFFSPKANPNLLQRAEIVALINTLHRFSESLHAVDVFRAMWQKDEDPTTLLKDNQAEKTQVRTMLTTVHSRTDDVAHIRRTHRNPCQRRQPHPVHRDRHHLWPRHLARDKPYPQSRFINKSRRASSDYSAPVDRIRNTAFTSGCNIFPSS